MVCSGWGEAVRSRWPDLWRVCRCPQWRKVCSFLLCQRHLSAVLLWAVLGANPLGTGPRVPQATRQRRSRPAARNAVPLVLRHTVRAHAMLRSSRCLLAECGSLVVRRVSKWFIIVVLPLCFYVLFSNSLWFRHIVVETTDTCLSYSVLFALWNILPSLRLLDSLELAIFHFFVNSHCGTVDVRFRCLA